MDDVNEIVDAIRDIDNQQSFTVSCGREQYRLHAVTDAHYEEPDRYGGGDLHLGVEFDDEHEALIDEHSCTGTILADVKSGQFETVYISICKPIIEGDYIVDEEWTQLGHIVDVDP